MKDPWYVYAPCVAVGLALGLWDPYDGLAWWLDWLLFLGTIILGTSAAYLAIRKLRARFANPS
jgi:hypothetical protein